MKIEVWSTEEGCGKFQLPRRLLLMTWKNLTAKGTHKNDKHLWDRLLFVQRGLKTRRRF